MREGIVAHPVRRVPPLDGRAQVLQHDAARPRGDDDRDRPRDARGRRERLLRRQHPQGERHPALLPVRRPRQPGAHDLQAVARPRRSSSAFGGRKEMSEYLASIGLPYRMGDREGVQHRRQRPRRDARGEGPRAARRGDDDRGPHHGGRVLEEERARRAGGGDRRVRRTACPSLLNGKRFASLFELLREAERDRRATRARDERPDREPRHRREEPRRSTRRRRWRSSTSRTSGSSRRSTTRTTIDLYATLGRQARAAPVRREVVRPRGADASRRRSRAGSRRR